MRPFVILTLAGCTVRGVVPPPSLGETPERGERLEICVPQDLRAAPERRGRKPGTALWAFGDVYEYTHDRGSTISRDRGLTPTEQAQRPGTSRPALILAEAVWLGLSRTEAYAEVSLGDACASHPSPPQSGVLLWSRLDYGYGSVLSVSKTYRYPVAQLGDRVWMDTTVDASSSPAIGYGRATIAVCTPDGCEMTTVAGQSSEAVARTTTGRPATSLRSRANIVYGRALSELAESMGKGLLESTAP